MEAFIVDLASKFPWVLTVISVIGILRIVVKPLMSIIGGVVLATESKKDDLVFEKVENSKIYKGVIYVLDWFASIKIK